MSDVLRIMTIGHSTRTAEQFIALLQAHGVTAIADVRTVPRSRRHPQTGGKRRGTRLPS